MVFGGFDNVFKKSKPFNLGILISKKIKSTVFSFKYCMASIAL